MKLRGRYCRHLLALGVTLLAPLCYCGLALATPPANVPQALDGASVSLATIPFSAPIGVISEVMRRDTILAKTLQAQQKSLVIQPFSKGQDMEPSMKRGDIDIALTGDMPALSMAAESDIIIEGLVKLGSGGIVSRNSYASLSDLRGKRIGVPSGASVYYGLLIALETAGMKEGDVEVVFMEPNELVSALIDKQIDAISIWPPVLDSALQDHPNMVVLQRFMNSSYILLRRSFADQEPEIAASILASYLRALRWMKGDPLHLLLAAGWAKESAENFQKEPFASLELIRTITKRDILAYAANPSIPRADREEGGQVHTLFTFLQKRGKLPAQASWARIRKSLDSHLLRDILAQPDKHLLNTFDYSQGN